MQTKTKDKEEDKPSFKEVVYNNRLIIIAFLLVVLLFLAFRAGVYYTCEGGLLDKALKCIRYVPVP